MQSRPAAVESASSPGREDDTNTGDASFVEVVDAAMERLNLDEPWAHEQSEPSASRREPSTIHRLPMLVHRQHDVTRPTVGREPGRRWTSPLVLAMGAIVAIGAGTFFVLKARVAEAPGSDTRPHLYVESHPAGAEVILNGQARGVTPLALVLSTGRYSMVLRHGTEERTVPLELGDGAQVQQYFEFAPPDPPASVQAEAPITTGAPATLARPLVPAAVLESSASKALAPGAGWLTVSAPFETEIHESNELLGTSRASKLMLAAGRHDIVLDNQTLQYQENRKIEIISGKTTTIQVTPPGVSLSANAQPWADVFMDGRSIGQTPLANIEVPLGTHEVIFRHPQLGERGRTVLVTANGPNRISVDLRQK